MEQAIQEFERLFDEQVSLQDKADAAFTRYFAKREAGLPTNGAAWQRLENLVSYKSAEVHSAASRLYGMDVDPETIREDYQP